jgi:LysM repeat protein
MARLALIRRSVARGALVLGLVLSMATPVAAGDDHVVQQGDTLWDIAQRHGTTVSELVRLNGITNPALIRVGQRIVLQPPASTPIAPAVAPSSTPASVVHVVKPDETLWGISIQYGTTIAAIVEANGIENPSFIRAGQALTIPAASGPPAAAPKPAPAAPLAPTAPAAAAPREHVVQAGETLWVIADRYATTVEAIADANGIANASFIRTGQRLVIPGTTAPVAAAGSVTNPSMPPDMAAIVAQRTANRDLLLAAAREFEVPGPFVLAVSWQESGWQPGVVSYAGAVGLMQLMPSTADWVAGSMLGEAAAISDARWNARAGARLLAYYLAYYDGNKTKTLAAYFQGMTSVDQIGVLQSTLPYINSILALEAIFSS